MYFYCYVYIFLFYVYIWPPWLRFFGAFTSVVRQMPGYTPQRRGTARRLSNFCVVLCIICLVSFCVLFVCICVLYYCHRAATQLQLTNISISYCIEQVLFFLSWNLSIEPGICYKCILHSPCEGSKLFFIFYHHAIS